MKLNYKKTIFVGFAFFLICAFWQAYDNTVPLILTNKFGMSQALSGAIMALDNILALFMLPLFGAISDRCHSKRGRRTPFILVGTVLAAISFVALSFVDGAQLKNIEKYSAIDDPAALTAIYEEAEGAGELMTPEGDKFLLSEKFTKEEFAEIKSTITNEEGKKITNPDYTNYVVPARQHAIQGVTDANKGTLIAFFVMLMITLVAMSTFRSPAVALMPDVTIKPLRSKANAVINLMGTAGGILVLALGMVFATSSVKNSMMSYTGYFAVIAGIMILSLLVFMLKVDEPKFVNEMEEESRRLGISEEEETEGEAAEDEAANQSAGASAASSSEEHAESKTSASAIGAAKGFKKALERKDAAGAPESGAKASESPVGTRDGKAAKHKLSPAERRSLIFILLSIVLWFMGYNAVTSKYSVYASTILHKDYNLTLIIAQVAAIISYLPVGIIASKIGRKKTIIAGVVMLAVSFGAAAFMRASSPTMVMNALFALAGIGWATINVNSFPMVVEMCSGADVGRYTGYYYTASMAAQVITPVISGFLMDKLGMTVLFPYAMIFAGAAIFTMLKVMHGDSKPGAKKGLEALEGADD